MNLFDMRTVIFSFAASNFICMIVMAKLWRQNRGRFAGLGFWMANFVLQFFALALFALRGIAPDTLSLTLSNAMIVGGTIVIYIGLEHFTGKKGPQFHNYILLAVFILLHTYFLFVIPSLPARNILVSLALLTTCFQCAWLILRRISPEMRRLSGGVEFIFFAFVLISILRIIGALMMPSGNEFFRSNSYETLLFVTYQMLYILLTFFLLLMVNRRLFVDLEVDIAAREQAEAAQRLSDEKFSIAFQSSPNAVIISRLRDGHIIEVNDGFCRLTGYGRAEALSGCAVSLDLWVDTQEWEKITAQLRANFHVRDHELDLRIKSGKILKVLYAGETMYWQDEAHVLSIVRDISERKRTEVVMQLRLNLWEFAVTHSAQELMRKALDEIETLTGSLIGFYHFVEEEQNTLTLQAWSTRTRNEFCRAEGEGMHYSIDTAGVWVDCVRRRGPVIHNDYASLPHRKGMPVGHAEIIRELVAPTMRDGRVVSILGVGNKPENYDEQDVAMVVYIADVVWTIVAQKQMGEKILKLNNQLEHLAMTDELTGLANRRFFFIQGTEEIKRARRYQIPLALIMLDIDGFKNINDTHGHEAGDAVLRCLAKILRETSREVDVTARLGGEEFGVLLPNTKAPDAGVLAERLRKAVEGENCFLQNLKMNVTVSIGVALFNQNIPNLDSLLHDADVAMYRAKDQGRNRVVLLE